MFLPELDIFTRAFYEATETEIFKAFVFHISECLFNTMPTECAHTHAVREGVKAGRIYDVVYISDFSHFLHCAERKNMLSRNVHADVSSFCVMVCYMFSC